MCGVCACVSRVGVRVVIYFAVGSPFAVEQCGLDVRTRKRHGAKLSRGDAQCF